MKRLLAIILLIAATNFSLLAQSTWNLQPIPTGYPVYSSIRDIYFFNSQTGLICGGYGILARTTDGGANWSKILSHKDNLYYAFSFFDSNTGWIGGRNYYGFELLKKTTNGGQTWDSLFFDGGGIFYDIMFTDINTGFAAGIYLKKTTNGGLNWFVIDPTSPYEYHHLCFINSNTGWVSKNRFDQPTFEYHVKLQKTTNGGQNWFLQINETNEFNNAIEDIEFINSNTGYIATADSGVFKTTNGGNNWIHTNSGSGGNMFFLNANTGWISNSNSIRRTTNGGLNWEAEIVTQYSVILYTLFFIDFFTGWTGGSASNNPILYKTINGGITAIENQISAEIPSSYALEQNYPNPFNPVTMINFAIPKSSGVKISVFDVTGKEVAELVNEKLQAGTYQTEWDGSNYSSGVYFYRMVTDGFSETRKMLLIR